MTAKICVSSYQLLTTFLFIVFLSVGVARKAAALSPDDKAPDLKPTSAVRLNLNKDKPQLTYIDFWAAWCGPCKHSLPWMNELVRKYEGKNFRIIAVNLDTEKEDADKLIKEISPRFEILFDPKGELPELYDVKVMPSSFLVGGNGEILSIFEGYDDETGAKIEEAIKRNLEGTK